MGVIGVLVLVGVDDVGLGAVGLAVWVVVGVCVVVVVDFTVKVADAVFPFSGML